MYYVNTGNVGPFCS